jgi:hypothetical protein
VRSSKNSRTGVLPFFARPLRLPPPRLSTSTVFASASWRRTSLEMGRTNPPRRNLRIQPPKTTWMDRFVNRHRRGRSRNRPGSARVSVDKPNPNCKDFLIIFFRHRRRPNPPPLAPASAAPTFPRKPREFPPETNPTPRSRPRQPLMRERKNRLRLVDALARRAPPLSLRRGCDPMFETHNKRFSDSSRSPDFFIVYLCSL